MTKNNNVLEKARQEIVKHGFDPDIIISMTGLGHDWNKLLNYFEEHDVAPRHYFDVAYLLQNEKALAYVERNNVPEEDIYQVNRLYQWNAPNIEQLLDSDVPLERIGNFQLLLGTESSLLRELFTRLNYTKGKFSLKSTNFNGEENDEGNKNKLGLYLKLLNSEIDVNEVREVVNKVSIDHRKEILDIELDPESIKFYEKIKDFPQMQNVEDYIIKIIALHREFCQEGIDFALEQGVPVLETVVVAQAYEKDPSSTNYILENFEVENFVGLQAAHQKDPEAFVEAVSFMEGKRFLPLFPQLYVEMSEKGRESLKQYINKLPEEVYKSFLESMNLNPSKRFEGLEFSLEEKILGYKASMPTVQVKDGQKILQKKNQIIAKSQDLEGKMRIKDVEFETSEFKQAVLETVGRGKYVTKEHLDTLCQNAQGNLRYRARNLQRKLEGIPIENVTLMANQLNVHANDLRKILGKPKNNGYFTLTEISDKLGDFVNLSEREVDPKDYGLQKIVEGEFKAQSVVRSHGIFGYNKTYSFIVALYPNHTILEDLKENDKNISSHIQDTIAYVRCYPEGKTLRIENLQTDIFDKEREIPASIKGKYQNWAEMTMLALEHFALTAGYKKIEMTTSELQIRKWEHHSGLSGITAYDTYTKIPKKMGYNLEKTSLVFSENTGFGMDMSNNWSYGWKKKQTYDLLWVKELNPEDLPKLDALFCRTDREKEVREQAVKVKPIKEKKDNLSLSCYRNHRNDHLDLFEKEE